jgi:hypothetical protein
VLLRRGEPEVAWVEVDGEAVVYHGAANALHLLDQLGARCVGGEVPADQVRDAAGVVEKGGGGPPRPPLARMQVELPHQP